MNTTFRTLSSTPATGALSRRTNLRLRAAAALLALGSLAGTVLAQDAPPPPPASGPHMMMHGGPMAGGPMHGPGMHGQGMDRMLDRVNATSEQRTKIRAIFDKARDDMRAQADTRKQLHEQGLSLLSQPTIDANAVEQLRQRMLAQHDQSSKRWMTAMVDAANVLTPQQRTQLAELMRQRAEQGPGSWHR